MRPSILAKKSPAIEMGCNTQMSRTWRIAAAFLLLLIVWLTRWPGLQRSIWNLDEGLTFTVAEQVLNGGIPYRDAADNRNPLVPYLKAAVFLVAGEWNTWAVHVGVALMLGLAAVVLWQIMRELGDETAGLLGALWYAFAQYTYLSTIDTMSAHTGWYMSFFSALGFWSFAVGWRRGGAAGPALAGLCLCLAYLSKQPALLDFGTALVLYTLTGILDPDRRGAMVRQGLMMTAGFVLPLAGTALYFWLHGAWNDFILYSWSYNTRLYIPEVPPMERLMAARLPFVLAWRNSPATLLAASLGAGLLLARAFGALRRRERFHVLPWLVLGWAASGLASTALSGREFDHYAMQIIPALSLASGWTLARAFAWARERAPRAAAPTFVLLLGLAVGFGLVKPTVDRTMTMDSHDDIFYDIGRSVAACSYPGEKVLVWGYGPEVYVFARRLPSTRFLYANYLTGMIPWTNLDLLKDTSYAVVPGAWEAFEQDWQEHPPDVILDLGSTRGYLKYPLERQAAIWTRVQAGYAEVDPHVFRRFGCRLFRRLQPAAANAATWNDAWKPQASFRAETTMPDERSRPARVNLTVPPGFGTVELYRDGRLVHSLRLPGNDSRRVNFFATLPEPGQRPAEIRAAARSSGAVMASPPVVLSAAPAAAAASRRRGPPLLFQGQEIRALETETIDGSPVTEAPSHLWNSHAPSRMVYPRPAAMGEVTVAFGIQDSAYLNDTPLKSDGIVVTVEFVDDSTKQTTELFRRMLSPVGNPADRGTQYACVFLPIGRAGRLVFRQTPGPMSDPTNDWSYWESLRGDIGAFALQFRGSKLQPALADAPFGAIVMEYRGRFAAMAHLPSRFEFDLSEGMVSLTGNLGMVDTAWAGPDKTIGAVFEAIQVLPDGKEVMLMQKSLEPAERPADRDFIPFRVRIPQPAVGRLRLVTRSPDPAKNEFGYTFWHRLAVSGYVATLRQEGRSVSSILTEGENGVNDLEENGSPAILAHAPATLVFPVEQAATRLKGRFGLLRRSFEGGAATAGATFAVEVEVAGGERREIWRQFVDPMREGAHRVPQQLDVALPADATQVILRTLAAPSGSLAYAWSYWQDLELGK